MELTNGQRRIVRTAAWSVAAGWTVLVLLHRARLLPFRPWLPIGQKALVASFIAWMAAQALALRRASR